MSKDLLDYEKHTGPRTCPQCGHQFPLGEFIKRFVMSYGFSKWPCPKCNATVKCDSMKIQIILLIGLLVSGVLFGVMSTYNDLGFLNIVYLIPGFVIVYLTFFYVKFKRYQ